MSMVGRSNNRAVNAPKRWQAEINWQDNRKRRKSPIGSQPEGLENIGPAATWLLQAQENERRQIARELHDEIGQELTGLRYLLEVASRASDRSTHGLLQQAYEIASDLMERVSQMTLELKPAILDERGLLPTLMWYFERYSSRTGVKVQLMHHGLEGVRFPPEVETTAYRIIQEALTNTARHSGIQEASVILRSDQNRLEIQVDDRGRGFEIERVLASGEAGGLSGMRERAAWLGGTLAIESHPGRGTRIIAELPDRQLGLI